MNKYSDDVYEQFMQQLICSKSHLTKVRIHIFVVSSMLYFSAWAWIYAFSALALFVGRQEEHLACKKLSHKVQAWLSVWSKVQMVCIWFR